MGFKDKKRKGVKATPVKHKAMENSMVKLSDIVPEKMEIDFNGDVARFKRLRYLGCPITLFSGNGNIELEKKGMVLLNRDGFVREMYDLFKGYSTESKTGYGRFCFLCNYVGYWDKKDQQTQFTEEEVLAYYAYREGLVAQGVINKNTLVKERQHLVSILKEQGKAVIGTQLPKVKNRRQATNSTKSIADKSYTLLGKQLMKAYQVYVGCVFNGAPPKKCPFFDSNLAIANGLTQEYIDKSRGLNFVEKKVYWTNTLSKLALLITAKWTGGNLTPLASLTKQDAKEIKKSSGDLYQFDSQKARALYERQLLGIGFTKRSKEFIESWLVVSDKIASGTDTPLFPLLDKNGHLKRKMAAYVNPHKPFNRKLIAMGLPEITTRNLRSTRSSVVMRAFEDIFVTATANRNSLETTQKHYLEGVEESHQMELARAFEVQKALVEGKDKKTAIDEFKEKIKDPFSSEEWLEKRKNATANKTLSGARCTEPKGDVAKTSLRAIRSLNVGGDRECISFLACFDCPKHALVAEVDDIWLMLSFRDSILDSISRPAINSVPKQEFTDTLDKTNYVLSRMEAIAPKDYKVANNKNKVTPHPLYQEENDLEDLLEIYAL